MWKQGVISAEKNKEESRSRDILSRNTSGSCAGRGRKLGGSRCRITGKLRKFILVGKAFSVLMKKLGIGRNMISCNQGAGSCLPATNAFREIS